MTPPTVEGCILNTFSEFIWCTASLIVWGLLLDSELTMLNRLELSLEATALDC